MNESTLPMGTVERPSSGPLRMLQAYENNPNDRWHPSLVSARRKTVTERSVGGAT